MSIPELPSIKQLLLPIVYVIPCLFLSTLFFTSATSQQELPPLQSEPFTLDLYHKFGSSPDQDFKLRGSIVVRPRSEYRAASASIINQPQLTEQDLESIKKASDQDDLYYLKVNLRRKQADKSVVTKSTQTIVKICSLYLSQFSDFINIQLSPINEFNQVNIYTTNQECSPGETVTSKLFNTTVLVDSGFVGPAPDTATYIKRLEDERQNKANEGKEDNRSFFAKYWIYIVPAVIILMVFSGPADQAGAR